VFWSPALCRKGSCARRGTGSHRWRLRKALKLQQPGRWTSCSKVPPQQLPLTTALRLHAQNCSAGMCMRVRSRMDVESEVCHVANPLLPLYEASQLTVALIDHLETSAKSISAPWKPQSEIKANGLNSQYSGIQAARPMSSSINSPVKIIQ
jgi:hypothetical protein